MKKTLYEELWACINSKVAKFNDVANIDDVMFYFEDAYNFKKQEKNKIDFIDFRPHLDKNKRWRA